MARLVAGHPHLPYVAPFGTFLLLLALQSVVKDKEYVPELYALRTFGALAVWLYFWPFYPRLGPAKIWIALPAGVLAAFGWVTIHKMFAAQAWYWPKPDPSEFYDAYQQLGSGWTFWGFLIVRIGGAVTVVPMIEEVFWRAFVLRALIDWDRWEQLPLGQFTWFSFIACSLLSALQHPQWEVGILCWMFYNALFYWTKSLLCLMITHGVTNLVLYAYVVVYHDWAFW
ncbi:MAG TPA: CAAX prenyl protease-related protein [Phycisphaerae bacterium]